MHFSLKMKKNKTLTFVNNNNSFSVSQNNHNPSIPKIGQTKKIFIVLKTIKANINLNESLSTLFYFDTQKITPKQFIVNTLYI